MTRQQGVLSDWNDDRGFGFIAPTADGPRVFAHVTAFPRERRPASNDPVSYLVHRDERNRLVASDVQYLVPARRARRTDPRLVMALVTATAFFVLLVILVLLGQAPTLLLVPYGLLSLLTYGLYGVDKDAALRGSWRVPESQLHLFALIGGWPGALVARRVFRHKTRKQPFRTIFWATVVANCVALGWFAFGRPLPLG